MGYFLNIILEDLDNIDDIHYVNEKKLTIDEKHDYLKKLFESNGFDNIRFSNLNAIGENPNENYYYFMNNISDLKYVSDNIRHENLPMTDSLRGSYRHDSNFYIIFLGEEKNYEYVKLIFDKLGMFTHKLFMLNESAVNRDFLSNLIGEPNKQILNIVYDRWDDSNNEYSANLHPSIKDYYRYKIQTGLFRFYGMFKEIRNCKLEEVRLFPDLNYFYFINGDNIHNHFREVNTLPLPEKVRKCFNECNNFNVILLNEHEFETEDFIVYLDNLVKKEKLDSSRIYLLNNNSKLKYYSEKHNISINTYSLDFLVKFIATHMSELGEPNFIENKDGEFFLCHNRSPKPHRYALLTLLKHENVIQNVDWSLIMGWYFKKEDRGSNYNLFFNDLFTHQEIIKYSSEIDFFSKIDIKKSKHEENQSWFDDTGDNPNIFWNKVYELKTYENSYVNIVTESCYFPKEIHITEKSMKPFYFYQFPIFLSSYNHVKYMKDRFGFDMFDDVIDHSYDNEIDNSKRLFMVFNEIKKLLGNKDKLIDFYKNNKNRFLNNREKVLDIYKSENDQNYFRNLINKK
jgi:hypothetical protein